MAFFIISPEIYAWVILPALIFLAQIANVCMETLRIVFLSKGLKYLAPIIAFFEIIIWLLAIVGVMSNLSNIANILAYAFGFALGTYVGLVIEERLSIGMVIMRIITTDETSEEIAGFLQAERYGTTCLDAKGARGGVRMIISLVNRDDVPRITRHIEETNPDAFFSIEDVRYVNQGVFRPRNQNPFTGFLHTLAKPRKKT
ncbi:MAG: DUF5698 domain-containing protein [Methanoregula sp.]|jgi:uncharacterized protein YebE (UPF0316 family)|uniref:DUF2179 domain-containing protein n=1 Tax=Methanoregula sp. TaxID=2052170 RepID=UPI003C23A24F